MHAKSQDLILAVYTPVNHYVPDDVIFGELSELGLQASDTHVVIHQDTTNMPFSIFKSQFSETELHHIKYV